MNQITTFLQWPKSFHNHIQNLKGKETAYNELLTTFQIVPRSYTHLGRTPKPSQNVIGERPKKEVTGIEISRSFRQRVRQRNGVGK